MVQRIVDPSSNESAPLIVLKRRANCTKSGETSANETVESSADGSNSLKSLVAEEGLEPPTRGL